MLRQLPPVPSPSARSTVAGCRLAQRGFAAATASLSLAIAIASQGRASEIYRFNHFAGVATGATWADGAGAAARFCSPCATAVDAAGNLFVADSGNSVIRRVSPTGAVTTIAGAPGQRAWADGHGAAARFAVLRGLAISKNGTLYVSDGSTVRRLSPEGDVVTIAGVPDAMGHLDGAGTAARFEACGPLAIDAHDTLYLIDQNTIRTIASDGLVRSIAGNPVAPGVRDGTGAAAGFDNPRGIAVDSTGIVYVADHDSIRRITTDGVVATFLPGIQPTSIAIDGGGNLVFIDWGAVYRATPAKLRSVVAAPADGANFGSNDGPSGAAHIGLYAEGLSVASDGTIYFADSDGDSVRKINADGAISTVAGAPRFGAVDGLAEDSRFWQPMGIGVDAQNNAYVADTYNHLIRKITPDGQVTTLAGRRGVAGAIDGVGAAARFSEPVSLGLDAAGNVYVVDVGTAIVRKITPHGQVTTLAGAAGQHGTTDGIGPVARFDNPLAIAVDAAGTAYIADRGRIRKIATDATVTTIYTSPDAFGWIGGISVDRDGTLYFTQVNDRYVGTLSSDGRVTVVAGVPGTIGWTDGLASTGRFVSPMGIFADRGVVYVIDGNTIRRVAGGQVITIGGARDGFGNADGLGTSATFDRPLGLALDADGVLLVADANNHAIRKGWPTAPETRAVNIAIRAYCASGNRVTIGGFVVSGAAAKRVLIRAVGPSLSAQGLAAAELLADPMVELHDAVHGNVVIARNDDWGESQEAPSALLAAAARVGAVPLADGDTKSSAMLVTLQPGIYSFVVQGKAAGSGIVLLEIYDTQDRSASARFVNMAGRAYATGGNGVAIGGFVIGGQTPKQVLMRAVGPSLTTQGISAADVLADPVIELHRGALTVATNDDWMAAGNSGDIVATANRVGAVALDATDTKSAALLTVLRPGIYSFVARGRNDTSGVVLVEVYDAD